MLLKEATLVYKNRRIPGERPTIYCMHDVVRIIRDRALVATREHFWVLYVNAKNEITTVECVAVGTLNGVEVHPREVFRGAILAGACSIILAHNHPSGDCEPSADDFALTRRMKEVGELIGIPVLDHIILGDDGFISVIADTIVGRYKP